jgi:hypothetical protein
MSIVQGNASAVQLLVLAFTMSGGQLDELPVHVSARSHSPAAARQSFPAPPAGCWHVTDVPSH